MTIASPDEERRLRVERSVFVTQLLFVCATLLLVAIAGFVQPSLLVNELFLAGVLIMFLATALSAVVPWRRMAKNWVIVIPLIDIVGLIIAREGAPLLGIPFLLVLPVIWLSTHFDLWGATVATVGTTLLLWGVALFGTVPLSSDEISQLTMVPIALVFVATTTYATTRRAAAQRVLLTQQSLLFESALRRSRRQERTLDEIFNAIDFGVIGFDRQHTRNFINRAQREMFEHFGISDVNLEAVPVYSEDQVTPLASRDRPFQRAQQGEALERMVVWVGDNAHEQMAVLVSARPILDENGAFDGSVMVTRDITAELRAIKARDDLVASVSHELRTPLTSIMGYLELALDDPRLDVSTRRMLEVASKNSDRLLALVSHLLAQASSDDDLKLDLAPCDLAAIVADAAESMRPAATDRGIRCDFGVLAPTEIRADAFRLRQVVDNLLSNAIKYNVHGGLITLSLSSSPTEIVLQVGDTGRGMTPDEQTKLFDRFYRADSVRGSSVHGTGLGLSISRDICREHGGDLRLESTSGQGTTAIMTLPRTT